MIEGINEGQWTELLKEMQPMDQLVRLIDQAIQDEPPLQITEGNVIKDGFNEQLDAYRSAMKNGKAMASRVRSKRTTNIGDQKT